MKMLLIFFRLSFFLVVSTIADTFEWNKYLLRNETQLIAEKQRIFSLNGIEKYNQTLEHLNLNDNNLKLAYNIKYLFKLRVLILNKNRISDLNYLSKLINIEELSLVSNKITNIDSIGNLINLHTLK